MEGLSTKKQKNGIKKLFFACRVVLMLILAIAKEMAGVSLWHCFATLNNKVKPNYRTLKTN